MIGQLPDVISLAVTGLHSDPASSFTSKENIDDRQDHSVYASLHLRILADRRISQVHDPWVGAIVTGKRSTYSKWHVAIGVASQRPPFFRGMGATRQMDVSSA